ncbi:Protein TIFY 4B-like isoform X1 [Asimina triloba]
MRRPSWNKWQAVQQVISLKTLLEARPDSGDIGIRQKTAAPCAEPDNPPAVRSHPYIVVSIPFSCPFAFGLHFSSADLQVESASGTDSVSDRSKDLQQSAVSGDVSSHRTATGSGPFPVDSTGISPRFSFLSSISCLLLPPGLREVPMLCFSLCVCR